MATSGEMRRSAFAWPIDGSNVIDLTERFRPAAQAARETDSEFQARIDRLLAEKPPQWPEYAFWCAVSILFTGGMFGVCAALLP